VIVVLDVNDAIMHGPGEIEYRELHYLQSDFFSELPVLVFPSLVFRPQVVRNPLKSDMPNITVGRQPIEKITAKKRIKVNV